MKMMLVVGLLTCLLCRVCAEENQPDRRVTFKKVGGVALDLHLFNPPEHQASDKRPAVVFFFGGGWNGGSPNQFYPHARYLASRGMVAIPAEYRVKSRHGTPPYVCVTDGKSAIRWVRQHASELGVDPDRIAAGGGSAGGHVAAATAMVCAFDDPADDVLVSAKPSALVLFNPVFDNGPDGFGHERVKDRWREFSPMHNITEGAPPTIVFLGSRDALIPVSTAEEYQRRMGEAGSRCDLWVYEGQAHGFFNFRDGKNPYYHATVIEADRFLASIGYLAGDPTLAETLVEGAFHPPRHGDGS